MSSTILLIRPNHTIATIIHHKRQYKNWYRTDTIISMETYKRNEILVKFDYKRILYKFRLKKIQI